ncbi:acylphosphatase [Luteococcus sediminum]|uniref:acylphosphatase n=1 Tax=Luteococcus sp. TaxID=1969402 RepID=UPI0037365090
MSHAVDLVVTGRVQGVGYRWSCAQQAEQLGVDGWVRNRPDGTVEVHAEGGQQAVERLVEWCRQGPRWAGVDQVHVATGAHQGLTGFTVR